MVRKSVAFIFIFTIIFGALNFLLFKTESASAAIDCLTITPSASESDKNYCKGQLADIEAQLQVLLDQQKAQQKQTGTLTGDVNYLTSQINALKTKVKARGLAIAQLKVSITEKVSKIDSLSNKIDDEHDSLAQLLRSTNEFDNVNIVHLVLSDNKVSDFYSDLESYASIKQSIKKSIDDIRGIKSETESQKADLEKKQNAETDAKAELEASQKQTTKAESDKKQLLAISKNQEVAYKTLAAQKKAQADKIRAALFSLAGISQKIEFGTALTYANEAKVKTGIDPAFLLAILTQESNLGANVGQCYLSDPATGAGVGKNTGTPFANVMKPMGLAGRKGDIEDFIAVTSKLGLNPYQTAVSCPIAGVGGYGGAMGPAQFIPSTWGGYVGRLKALLGYDANPWAPKDAFMASALLLTDKGAIGTSQSAQNIAACKYYGTGGATCAYGNSVARLKIGIQANIDLLNQ